MSDSTDKLINDWKASNVTRNGQILAMAERILLAAVPNYNLHDAVQFERELYWLAENAVVLSRTLQERHESWCEDDYEADQDNE